MAPGQVHPLSRARAPGPAPGPRPAGGSPGTAPLGVLADVVPASRSVGLYVHVPFCERRCHYCSFTTAPRESAEQVRRYLAAARRELALLARAPWAPGLGLATVFFGGGTPSLLEPDQLAGLLAGAAAGFPLAPGAEVTVECNPESVTAERLAAYRAAGVTRISLGVQSLDDAVLRTLGRLHDAAGAGRAFADARRAGFDRISVDLMYGLPGLDREGWRRTVTAVLDWEPDHLSAYALTLDEGSRWGAAGAPPLPAEEDTVAQYRELAGRAAARGFEHYEISNWARPGGRSRHNLGYWRRREYLACGPGACGFLGDLRWSNARALARYCGRLEAGALPVESWERLTPAQARAEALILGLRTADGVAARPLAARLAGDRRLAARVEEWRQRGLLAWSADTVRLTEDGFLLSDALFVELL